MAEFTKFRPKYDQTGNVTGEYDELRRQHNIMCLIGNGFDRAILRREEFRNSRSFYLGKKMERLCSEGRGIRKSLQGDRSMLESDGNSGGKIAYITLLFF